ncbi:MAG: hypothetical protein PHU52_05165 [Dehalococcoidales bacterium]|nr:hypothetical protein [Dehalococcoidales bacterium]
MYQCSFDSFTSTSGMIVYFTIGGPQGQTSAGDRICFRATIIIAVYYPVGYTYCLRKGGQSINYVIQRSTPVRRRIFPFSLTMSSRGSLLPKDLPRNSARRNMGVFPYRRAQLV